MLEEKTVAVQRSANEFRKLAENLGDVFWLADAKSSRLLYISPGCNAIWGYSANELRARPGLFESALHPADRPRCSLLFAGASHSALERSEEYRIRHRDGDERLVRVRLSLLRDAAGGGVRIAGIASDVTSERRDQTQLRADRVTLCDLTTQLIRREEEERSALATDLHDGLTQMLSAAKIGLSLLRQQLPDLREASLAAIEDWIAQALDVTRSITSQLSPPVLRDFGLMAALEWLTHDLLERYGLRIAVTGQIPGRSLRAGVSSMLYRSIRELLINVAKHARSEWAQVTLGKVGASLRVEVTDRGCGFHETHEPRGRSAEHFGLASIRQRVESLGGKMQITSRAGRGTRVTLIIPATTAPEIAR